jgi:SAM-dependent methyltransferase
MNPEEYARMHQFEDWYWWFVARRRSALQFVADYGLRRPTNDDRPTTNDQRPTTNDQAPCIKLRILDAGCGTGALLDGLNRIPGALVFGADIAREALAFSAGRGHRRLAQTDLTALPFADNSFEIVTALDVVEHVEDDVGALREIARVLRPGGVLLMSVPAYRFLWSSHDVALHHKRRYTTHSMEPRLRKAGLTPVKLTYLLAFLFPAIALYRLADRLRQPRGEPKAHLVAIPSVINRFLIALQEAELSLARRINLPFGVTLFCVARKSEGPCGQEPGARSQEPNG